MVRYLDGFFFASYMYDLLHEEETGLHAAEGRGYAGEVVERGVGGFGRDVLDEVEEVGGVEREGKLVDAHGDVGGEEFHACLTGHGEGALLLIVGVGALDGAIGEGDDAGLVAVEGEGACTWFDAQLLIVWRYLLHHLLTGYCTSCLCEEIGALELDGWL